jgi:hypothetical protein
VAAIKTLLARVRKLEREHGTDEETRALYEWAETSFDTSIAQGVMCGIDGPMIKDAVLKMVKEGSIREL